MQVGAAVVRVLDGLKDMSMVRYRLLVGLVGLERLVGDEAARLSSERNTEDARSVEIRNILLVQDIESVSTVLTLKRE